MAWYSAEIVMRVKEHDANSSEKGGVTKYFWDSDRMSYDNLGYDQVVGLQMAAVEFMKKLQEYGLAEAQSKGYTLPSVPPSGTGG